MILNVLLEVPVMFPGMLSVEPDAGLKGPRLANFCLNSD